MSLPEPGEDDDARSSDDSKTLEDLFREWYPRLVAQALVISGGRLALAQDAAQESFLQCWRRMQQTHLAAVTNWPAWLRTTLVHEVLRLVKINARTEVVGDEAYARTAVEFDWAALVDLKDAYRKVCEYVATLSDRQREVIARCTIAGEPLGTVAAEMGITEGTARAHLYRARQALRPIWVELMEMGVIGEGERGQK
ncbi:RNA polymerase sigma factor [Streptomyces sp. NPDC017964]|uniref:RNA polymerase sigma factor n=1 Tax=Streptomyces sp. NPDC017964 TaxID=3365022 RepID=UPI0037A6BBEA